MKRLRRLKGSPVLIRSGGVLVPVSSISIIIIFFLLRPGGVGHLRLADSRRSYLATDPLVRELLRSIQTVLE